MEAELEQAQAARLKESQARSLRTQSEAATPTPPSPPLGFSLGAESGLSPGERLNAERARAATTEAPINFNPSVERFANAGNIPDEEYAAAMAEMEMLNEQIRTAGTLAQAQGLAARFSDIERGLLEAGLSDEQSKAIQEAREQFWRGVRTAGPAIDDFIFGMDFGLGTFVGETVNVWQFVKGLKYRGTKEPLDKMSTLLTPPPYEFSASVSEGGKLLKRVFYWGLDILGSVWGVLQVGFVITIILMNLAIVYMAYTCWLGGNGILQAGTASICIEFAGGVLNALGGAATQ